MRQFVSQMRIYPVNLTRNEDSSFMHPIKARPDSDIPQTNVSAAEPGDNEAQSRGDLQTAAAAQIGLLRLLVKAVIEDLQAAHK